ncbi:MAG: hypothetical protein ACLQJL_14905 [Roseiarcus sp.]
MQTTLIKRPAPPPDPTERRTEPAAEPVAPRDAGVDWRGPPGGELHPAVYRSLLVAPIVIALASWLAFGRGGGVDLDLTMVCLVFGAFAAIPTLLYLAGGGARRQETLGQFVRRRVETASGAMTGRQAWIEIALIPAALAIAAVLFGLASAVAS